MRNRMQRWLAVLLAILLCLQVQPLPWNRAQSSVFGTANAYAETTETGEPTSLATEPAALTETAPAEEPTAQVVVEAPNSDPTATPTTEPTATPTPEPTATPTAEPIATPTTEPTATIAAEPTESASVEPSESPSENPSESPTPEGTAEPTVTPQPITVTLASEILLAAETQCPAIGVPLQLNVTVLPEDALTPTFTFTSSDETVLTVDENGLVTGLVPGVAIVTVTAGYDMALVAQAFETAAAEQATALEAALAPETANTETVSPNETTTDTVEMVHSDTATAAIAMDAEALAATALEGFVPLTATLQLCVGLSFVGEGTLENPFQLTSADELMLLAQLVNSGIAYYATATYQLANDIYMPNRVWTAIGTAEYPFQGSLDGGSYKIYSLERRAKNALDGAYGLFGVTQNATLIRLALESCNMNVNVSDETLVVDAGLIVGRMIGGTLSRSYVTGTIDTKGAGMASTGGLVGRVVGGSISDCFSLAGVKAHGQSGVLAGVLENDAVLETSYSRSEPTVAEVTKSVGLEETSAKAKVVSLEADSQEADALTYVESKNKKNYDNFDFGSVWQIDTETNAEFPFPVLRDNPYTGAATYGADVVELGGMGLLPVSGASGSGDSVAGAVTSTGDGDSTFSLVDEMPAVRNQGSLGTCWTFATLAAVESNAIRKGLVNKSTVNLAELHTMWFTNMGAKTDSGAYEDPLSLFGGDHPNFISSTAMVDKGGSPLLAMYTLADQMMPAAEAGITAYSASNGVSIQNNGLSYAYAFDDNATLRIKGVYIAYMDDRNAVKSLITNYGGVAAQYNVGSTDSDIGNYSTCGAFFKSTAASSANHAICIVGWDDNYPKTNFAVGNQPSIDGAWLVRNSWGADWQPGWGLGGYFWASYEDYWFGTDAGFAIAFDTQSASAYDYCYQYDGSNLYGGNVKTTASSITGANVFTSQQNEELSSVSFWSESIAGQSYTVKVYRLAAGDTPDSGTLLATKSGSTGYEGYYTVKLDSPVYLAEGDRFSVVLTLNKAASQSYSYLSIDKTGTYTGWLNFYAYTQTGESYYKSGTATAWTDSSYNIRLKAFTSDAPAPTSITLTAENGITDLAKNATVTMVVTTEPSNASTAIDWTVTPGTGNATVENGVVTGTQMGDVTITATSVFDETVTASYTLTIIEPLAETAEIWSEGAQISTLRLVMIEGETTTATATARFTCSDTVDAPLQGVEWSVGDTEILLAQPQSDGSVLLTVSAAGSTTLTATSKDGSGVYCTIPVQCVPDTKIVILGETDMMSRTNQTLRAKLFPAQEGTPSVSWSLQNTADRTYATLNPTTGYLYVVNTSNEAKVITVIATSLDDAALTASITIRIHPRVVKLGIQNESNITVTGLVVPMDINTTQATFTAFVLTPASGALSGFTWSNSHTSVASIEQGAEAGQIIVKPLQVGTTTLTAKATDGSNVTAMVKVQVKRMVTGITLGGSQSIAYGKSIQVYANVAPSNATTKTLRWSVSDTARFSINAIGVLKANNLTYTGPVTVTATAMDGLGATSTYEVTQYAKAVSSVKITDEAGTPYTTSTIALDTATASLTLKAFTLPDTASQQVIWKLNTTNYLTVATSDDASITLVPKANGVTIVTAKALDGSGISTSLKVVTTTIATNVEVTSAAEVARGKTITLTANVTAENGIAVSNKSLNWYLVDDEGTAVLQPTSNQYATLAYGKLTVKSTAEVGATIKVRATTKDGSAVSDDILVTVMAVPVTAIPLQYTVDSGAFKDVKAGSTVSLLMETGTDPQFKAAITTVGASTAVIWTISSTKYATLSVDGDGIVTVTPLRAGTVTLRAIARDGSGKEAYVTLVFKKPIKSLTASVAPNVALGRTIKPMVTYDPADATTRKVTWVFSDPTTHEKSTTSPYATLYTTTGTIVPKTGSFGHTVTLVAIAADGSGVISNEVTVTITPVTTAFALSSNGVSVNSKTLPMDYYNLDTATYGTLALVLNIAPAGASSAVAWSTSNANVATVVGDGNGATVTATGIGQVKIAVRATDGTGFYAYVNLRINRVVRSITINAPDAIATGKAVNMTATLAPVSATLQQVTWALATDDANASNRNYSSAKRASITTYGLTLTLRARYALAGETLTLVCRSADGAVTERITIPVKGVPTAIQIWQTDTDVTDTLVTLAKGSANSIALTATADDGASQAVTWRVLTSYDAVSITTAPDGTCTVTRNAAGNAVLVATATDGSAVKGYLYLN